MRRANRAVHCSLGHVLPVTECVEKMGNERLIYAITLVLIATLVVTIASALVKSLLRFLVLILYSIFWGEGTVYISMLSHVFPENLQQNIIEGYDYYKQQELPCLP